MVIGERMLRAVVFCLLTAGCTAAPRVGSGPSTRVPVIYRCESGQTVRASYPATDSAVVEYGGATYRMTPAVSADGVRYVGGGYQWWTRGVGPGAEASLRRFRGDEQVASGDVESCTWESPSY